MMVLFYYRGQGAPWDIPTPCHNTPSTIYGMFYEVVYQKLRIDLYTRPLLLRTWPLPRTCLPARRGLDTRLGLQRPYAVVLWLSNYMPNVSTMTNAVLPAFDKFEHQLYC